MPEAAVEGIDELFEKLDDLDLPYSKEKAVLAASVRKGSEVIREEGSRRAPQRTGKLRAQMIVSVVEQTASHVVGRIGPSRKAFYGIFQETGTAHMHAQAFLGPAFEAKIVEAVRVMGETLNQKILAIAKRQAKGKKY